MAAHPTIPVLGRCGPEDQGQYDIWDFVSKQISQINQNEHRYKFAKE